MHEYMKIKWIKRPSPPRNESKLYDAVLVQPNQNCPQFYASIVFDHYTMGYQSDLSDSMQIRFIPNSDSHEFKEEIEETNDEPNPPPTQSHFQGSGDEPSILNNSTLTVDDATDASSDIDNDLDLDDIDQTMNNDISFDDLHSIPISDNSHNHNNRNFQQGMDLESMRNIRRDREEQLRSMRREQRQLSRTSSQSSAQPAVNKSFLTNVVRIETCADLRAFIIKVIAVREVHLNAGSNTLQWYCESGTSKTIKNVQKVIKYCGEHDCDIPDNDTNLNSFIDQVTDGAYKTKTVFYQKGMKRYGITVGEWWPGRGSLAITDSEVDAQKNVMQQRYNIVRDHMRSLRKK